MSDTAAPEDSSPAEYPALVAICVATYRRPGMLRQLLVSLGAQQPKKAKARAVVIVVDNDEAGSAREVVESCRRAIPIPLEYEIEPVRNIALARNRAVRAGQARGAEFFAFIDDDEVARENWLDELLAARSAYAADVVSGVVLPRYEKEVPDWVTRGGFFEERPQPTGSLVAIAHTNNVLVSGSLFSDSAAPFDPEFGRSGGEDSHFFMRMRERGARIIRSNEAVVEEVIPSTRANWRWIVRRAFRIGTATVACERSLFPLRRWFVPRCVKGTGRLIEGALVLPFAALRGRAAVVSSLRKGAHGAGCIAGLLGYRYREYEAVHGS